LRNPIIEEDIRFITDAPLPWEAFKGKNILISGASGLLPSYIVETLLFLNEIRFENKLKVFALVRNKEKALKRFASYNGRSDLVFIVQDVCEQININNEIHVIIHAASQASPKYYGKDPVGTLSANVLGTRNLLEFAKTKKIECFLFFSAGEIYGEVPEKNIPIKEDAYGYIDPTLVRSCYAEGKRVGETMCVCWFHQYGIPAKIVRPFHTYGPGLEPDDGRVFSDFVYDILQNKNIVMKSDGGAIRSFCYIADATLGFFTVLLKGNNAEAYNVGNEKGEISIRDLAHKLANLFSGYELKVEINKNMIQEGYIKSKITRHCPDTSKIRSLGWAPRYSLEEGFKRTVRSFSWPIG